MSGLQFIREEQAFMDNQVDLWMNQLVLDPELEVPHSVLKYFFHKCADRRDMDATAPTARILGQRRPFGHRARTESPDAER